MGKVLYKDQRGIAPLMLILGLLVVVVIGATAYFVIGKNKDSNGSNSETSKAVAAECTKEIDDKEFCKFVSNWTYGKEQKMVITVGGEVTTMETDANGNTSMTSASNGTETYAFISMGNSTYMKNVQDGNWTKYTSEDPADATESTSDEIESELDFESEATKNTSKITAEGKEACGSNTCFRYLITDTTTPGEETRVWFDDDEYKLRKMVTTNAEGSTEFVVSYEVKAIVEPSPIVEAPNFDNMSAEELQRYMEQYAQ